MSPLRRFVKQASVFVDRIASPPAGVTMLIYHRVGAGTGTETDIDAAVFDRQLAHLAEHHRVITLDEAAAELAGGRVAGPPGAETAAHSPTDGSAGTDRAVVLTFDDGTDDFGAHVVPALARHGLPATLYATTHFIESGERFPWGAAPTSWPELREAVAGGLVTVGSHTHTHALLDRLGRLDVADELDRSTDLLRERLDVDPVHFAYPKAVPGSAIAEIAVRRRFRTAALAANRVNRVGDTDLHRLGRTPIKRSDGFDVFARKAAGGMRLEGELRERASRFRYRSAST